MSLHIIKYQIDIFNTALLTADADWVSNRLIDI